VLAIKGLATTAGTFSGGNLKTVTDPTTGAINLQMADAPKFGNIVINDGGKISGLADGTNAGDAVNKKQLDAVDAAAAAAAATAGKGWNIQANSGTADKIAPGETVNFAAGTNAVVAYDASTNKMTVGVVDAPTFSGKITANGGLDMGNTKIVNVAAGTNAADAVNFGQLTGVSQSVADALGGGSKVDPATGKVTEPTYTVDGKTTNGVDGAISALDTSVKAAKDGIDGLNADMTDVVKYDTATHDKVTFNAGGTSATRSTRSTSRPIVVSPRLRPWST
jgi:hypothetical protein